MRVMSITPTPGASSVPFTSRVTVKFSQALAARIGTPILTPAVPGAWVRVAADELVFEPHGNFVPYAKETVTVPDGVAGPTSTRGVHLTSSISSTFTIEGASVLRLQQLLAELGYLPVKFTPSAAGARRAPTRSAMHARLTSAVSGGSSSTTTTAPPTTTLPPTTTTTLPAPTVGPPGLTGTVLGSAPAAAPTSVSEPADAADIPLEPVAGTFSWRFGNIPGSLAALWAPGAATALLQGAVMRFEADHGLATDGQAGPAVWAALLQAVAQRDVTSAAYDYVEVTTSSPEYLALWRNGVIIFTTLVNTGIPQATTALGTWPVYVRYTVTTMSGTNPDGSHYSDPGIPWVSYFHGGDALHGYLRSQYGYPQSLGCVEMPYSSASTVYPFTPLGTLVTVL
jgi:peptidoglycan hydrolase-like protein with peptidoglycan-binding domain